MPEPLKPGIPRNSSSSGLVPAAGNDGTTIRPRNRRTQAPNGTNLLSTPSASPSRGASPIPSARIGSVTGRNNAGIGRTGSPGFGSGLLGGGESVVSSWAAPAWSSLQGFTNSVFGAIGGGDGTDDGRDSRTRSTTPGGRKAPLFGRKTATGTSSRNGSGTWGPEPPGTDKARRPRLDDVAAGSLAKREAALKAAKTASVLESHEGVNGGLDVSGRFKKRRSDEDLQGSSNAGQTEETDEHLVYIHQVQKNDTYAGIVLKYRCQEDAFRKANGLWSRDNHYIQIRKWLALPVDACEIRGRPCEGPSYFNSRQVDLLAPTPKSEQDNPYESTSNGKAPEQQQQPRSTSEEDRPWTHVKWVTIDSFTTPVEIARVPRKALGYFPPRRKKSLHTVSSNLSTPRGSIDVPSIALGSEPPEHNIHSSPASTSSRQRRLSLLGASRSVGAESTDNIHRPAWMRRPGGVGSLHGRNVRAPGPERDYFNTWTKKHLPGLNIDTLPSMSVMGSESARFGFRETEEAGIVESPFEEGRDMESVARGNESGTGLDKAAAAVETWLRGAFAKLPPGTPTLGPRGRREGPGDRREFGDLIELTDTNSDDGRGGGGLGDLLDSGLLGSGVFSNSGRSESGGDGLRGRSTGLGKGKKAD